jgi:hypothetical protein
MKYAIAYILSGMLAISPAYARGHATGNHGHHAKTLALPHVSAW